MKSKCNNCGNIFNDTKDCPNCKSASNNEYHEDLTWYNIYASEKMTVEEAVEFFETDKY